MCASACADSGKKQCQARAYFGVCRFMTSRTPRQGCVMTNKYLYDVQEQSKASTRYIARDREAEQHLSREQSRVLAETITQHPDPKFQVFL